ncbi:MAG: ROK family protein [Phycisphaerales bacterium]|nr:ROK family protein [Phycisphaerales bacterium]
MTERRVAHLLLCAPGLTRFELSQETGLSVATIGKIIEDLTAAGIVEKIAAETSKPGPSLGRPAEYFGLARSGRRNVVVELGVKKTQVAALPIAGPVGDIQTATFQTTSDLETFETRLKAAVARLDIDDPRAVIVSTPGVVDEAEKKVLYSPNLHWTEGTRLFEVIENVIGVRVVVVQEVRALALGYLARSDPHDSFLLVDSGDGVGGALVIDGHLQTGPLPLVAEVGHSRIPGNRRVCGCGAIGCLETILTRAGLLKTARQHSRNRIRNWAQFINEFGSQDLPNWLNDTLDDASRIIAIALNTVGVPKVVLIGDLVDLGSGVLERIAKGVNSDALWGRFGNIRIEAAPKQRLLGLTRAAIDRVVFEPTPTEVSLGRHARANSAG